MESKSAVAEADRPRNDTEPKRVDSQAEVEALRAEMDALRAEVEILRGDVRRLCAALTAAGAAAAPATGDVGAALDLRPAAHTG